MPPAQALAFIAFAREFHEGKHSLPPEIIDVITQIKKETKKAELFIVIFGVVDQGMVNKVVDLMHQRDNLYSGWAEKITSMTIH